MKVLRVPVLAWMLLGCTSSTDVSTPVAPGGMTPPVAIHKVNPDYPPELRREGVTGVVTIVATIDRTGRLLEPRVVRSSDPRLDDLAVAAVRKWRFKPGTMNGEPVDVVFSVDVSFSIP